MCSCVPEEIEFDDKGASDGVRAGPCHVRLLHALRAAAGPEWRVIENRGLHYTRTRFSST